MCAFWLACILIVTLPWGSFQDHAHWDRVRWIPFLSPPFSILDLTGNVVAYLPAGYLFRRLAARRTGLWPALACAVALSLMTEATQVFSHSRFPSMTDVICNGVGTWIGAAWARAQERKQV